MYRRSSNQAAREARRQTRRTASDDVKTRQRWPLEDLEAFEEQVHGVVIVPGDPEYDAARQVFYRQFQCFPEIIVYCHCANDVAACLALARTWDLPIVCRSGGHSSAGFSINNGMVIDLSQLDSVHVDPVTHQAVVGGGTSFHRLNAVLSDHGLHVPGGGCDDVCIGGYMQGGGYGFTSREFGMNCDCVTAFDMMLWNGGIVRADADTNADLFWSVRGGMGTNYGVLLSVTYQLYPLGDLYGFGLSWDADHAAAALVVMQDAYIAGDRLNKLGYQGAIMIAEGAPRFYIRGMFDGDKDTCLRLLEPLTTLPGTTWDIELTGPYAVLNQVLLAKPVPIPNAPDDALEEKQSGYVGKALTAAQWQVILDFMRTAPCRWNNIGLEPYGGVIARQDDPNAFIHRDVLMNLFVEVFWVKADAYQVNIDWLNAFMRLLEPYLNGRSYQNYPRPDTPHAEDAYWADYLGTLAMVKAKYNPHNWFANPQRIAPVSPPIIPPPKGPRFPDAPIVYIRSPAENGSLPGDQV